MKKVTTPNGFTCEINEDNLGDPVIFRKMVRLQKGDYSELIDVIEAVIGPSGWDDLTVFTQEKNGRARVADMVSEFYEAMKMAGDDKKK